MFLDSRTSNNASSPLARGLLAVAIAWSLFRGYRMPNLWSINYYQLSMFDGFFRRSMLGTLLSPLGCLRFSYEVIAAIQMLVLLALIVVLVVQAMRSDALSYLAGWFFACGGFLFHEVGYVEQAIYLAVFGGLYLCHQRHYAAAALLGILLTLTSEIALLSAVPLLAVAPLLIHNEREWWKPALKILAPAVVVFAVQSVWFQSYPAPMLSAYLARIHHCGYELFRRDYLDAMSTSYTNRYALYFSVPQIVFALVPLVALAVLFARRIGASFSWSENARLAVMLAGISPLALGLAGWDTNRWIFLAFTNITIMLMMASRYQKESGAPALHLESVQALILLLALTLYLPFFDGLSARQLAPQGFADLIQHLQHSFLVRPQQ